MDQTRSKLSDCPKVFEWVIFYYVICNVRLRWQHKQLYFLFIKHVPQVVLHICLMDKRKLVISPSAPRDTSAHTGKEIYLETMTYEYFSYGRYVCCSSPGMRGPTTSEVSKKTTFS